MPQGKDHTLMAQVEGFVRFWRDHPNSAWRTKRRYISVESTRSEAVAKQVGSFALCPDSAPCSVFASAALCPLQVVTRMGRGGWDFVGAAQVFVDGKGDGANVPEDARRWSYTPRKKINPLLQ